MGGNHGGAERRARAPHSKAEAPPTHPLSSSELAGRLLGAHVSISGGVGRAVERAIQCGFSAAQIFLKNCRQWKAPAIRAEEAAAFQRAASSSGILFFGHAGYLINLASPSEPLAGQSLESLSDEITRAECLRLPFLVVHPGAGARGEAPEAALARLVGRLRLLFPAGSPEPSIRIALETMAGQGSQIGWRLDHLASVLNELADPRHFGLCLDTAHLWAAGYPIATRAGYQNFTRELERLALVERVLAFHLNGSLAPFGSRRDRHGPLGRDTMGLAAFGQILGDPRWSGLPMVLETPKEDGMEADCRNLRAILPFLSQSHPQLAEGRPEKVRKPEKKH
ncbi:deoxyribonuclease IV [Verrucomicrobium sp. 3C]|uniref:deoxyribonuclease IV n=1 Tax=Verrucomicrobium sp. 3C TaxID=1134055 RepID=UPI00036A2464|nr:deoxyribonuclease IV [Verrucomicrobium sp. 3C]